MNDPKEEWGNKSSVTEKKGDNVKIKIYKIKMILLDRLIDANKMIN